jgi:hypothetical protein
VRDMSMTRCQNCAREGFDFKVQRELNGKTYTVYKPSEWIIVRVNSESTRVECRRCRFECTTRSANHQGMSRIIKCPVCRKAVRVQYRYDNTEYKWLNHLIGCGVLRKHRRQNTFSCLCGVGPIYSYKVCSHILSIPDHQLISHFSDRLMMEFE